MYARWTVLLLLLNVHGRVLFKGKGKRKGEAFGLPSLVSVPWLIFIFIYMLTCEMSAVMKLEVAFVLFFLLKHTLRISCPANIVK